MQTHALALANHLHARGYPVEVLTYRANRHEEKNAAHTVDAHLPFPVHRILSRVGYWHNVDTITARGREFKPDLIYCSTVFYGFISQELHVPVICRSVGNDIMRPWIVYPFRFAGKLAGHPLLERRLYDLFKRFNYPEWVEILFHKHRYQLMVRSARLLNYVMANSRFTADLLRDIGLPGDRVGEVVGGVDAARFACKSPERIRKKLRVELNLPQKCYLMTTACRLVAKKGVDFLIPSFLELRKRMPDAHLLIIGEGRHEKRYRRLARRLGLREHITFTGRIPQADIQKYYWASNAFVLASRVQVNPGTGLRDAETMGRVLCEANAAGIPVIAARSGGIPSVIRHRKNGLLFEPDNLDDFIAQVVKLRKDATLRKQMVKTGISWAQKKFDWSVIVARHEDIMEKVLARAGGKRKPSKVTRISKARKPRAARTAKTTTARKTAGKTKVAARKKRKAATA